MDSPIVYGSVFAAGTGVSSGSLGGYGVHILLGNTEYVSPGITMRNNRLLRSLSASPSAPPVCAVAPYVNQHASKKLNRTMRQRDLENLYNGYVNASRNNRFFV